MLLKIILVIIAFQMTGCAQFAEIDRGEVNRPSMSFQRSLSTYNTTPLTNLKSSGQVGVGSCTVCSH